MIASPGGKLSGNRLFGTDFLTEEECGRQLTMTTHLKTCSSGESCNGPMRRSDVLYELSGFCPHSSSDPFGATLPPGEGIFPPPGRRGENDEKPVDNSKIHVKIFKILQRNTEKKQPKTPGAKRGQWEPSGGIRCGPLSCGLRDQDGCSRYRASKMLSLQRSRVVPCRKAPLCVKGGFFILYIFSWR